MEDFIDVSVCLGSKVLRTTTVFTSTIPGLYSLNNLNPGHNLPDSDRLYLEDIDGFRYKRVFPVVNIPDWFYFEKI